MESISKKLKNKVHLLLMFGNKNIITKFGIIKLLNLNVRYFLTLPIKFFLRL